MKFEYRPYTLDFKFKAGTSRGVLTSRDIWWIKITDNNGVSGYGEVAPLKGLSLEKIDQIPKFLEELAGSFKSIPEVKNIDEVYELSKDIAFEFPSLRFGLEMALIDILNGGNRQWFHSSFTEGKSSIPTNGLIWMGDPKFMRQQVDEKLEAGFKCIKLKVGAMDFDEELKLVQYVRQRNPDVVIRLDANGGFTNNEAIVKLNKLSEFDIHSIEQPIMVGQPEAMAFLCEKSLIPIALDEELIAHQDYSSKIDLLETVEPDFIILKPSLLGGFKETITWITMAEYRGIGWWITSALESNLGLNAISQFTAQYKDLSFQGLGTGQLYHNNVDSKSKISGTMMVYDLLETDEVKF